MVVSNPIACDDYGTTNTTLAAPRSSLRHQTLFGLVWLGTAPIARRPLSSQTPNRSEPSTLGCASRGDLVDFVQLECTNVVAMQQVGVSEVELTLVNDRVRPGGPFVPGVPRNGP